MAAELSKRGIPNSLLPENFSDDDILIGKKDGTEMAFIQVKSCHPERSETFILSAGAEEWVNAHPNEYVIFVWLGAPNKNESPKYWIALKKDVGTACTSHGAHGTSNWERRFYPKEFPETWENNWQVFGKYMPQTTT